MNEMRKLMEAVSLNESFTDDSRVEDAIDSIVMAMTDEFMGMPPEKAKKIVAKLTREVAAQIQSSANFHAEYLEDEEDF